jgi:serine/threonine-protein kinase
VLWYRTSPRTLIPFGLENRIEGLNPPLNISGMTLVVVDSAGRLAELLVVPQPREPDQPVQEFTNWPLMFELAGLSMADFKPATPRWVPPIYAEHRMAWEGRIPEVPDATVRVEAGATHGRPVMFSITGSWSQSVRTPDRGPASLFARVIGALAGFVMPLLMLVGPILAYRNVKLGRGDRRGAFRAASAVFFLIIGVWLLGDTHVPSFAFEQARLFSAIGMALFNAGLLWLTYLGLEPYVRRFSPDSLVGWTRLVAGDWRDPRVGRDVLIGISAGLAMTVVFGIHNLLPPLFGRPEPMPVAGSVDQLMSLRFVLAQILRQVQSAISSGMLGVGGFVALRILLKRRLVTAAAATICFVWVVLEGMFSPGIPALDFIMGLVITAIFVAVVGWGGLLATVVTLATHFLLLRGPLTTDLASWRATAGLAYLAVVLGIGFWGCYLAARPAARAMPRFT